MQQVPPPLPARPRSFTRPVLLLLIGCSVFTLVFLILYCGGRLHFYWTPSESMQPTLMRNDRFFMEGVSYFFRTPERGEIVVYRAEGPAAPQPGQLYLHRVVGMPGETLRISDGKLYVNGQHFPIANGAGEIAYMNNASAHFLQTSTATVTVPPGQYFVLGDYHPHSLDSRFLGPIPIQNIRGRVLGRK